MTDYWVIYTKGKVCPFWAYLMKCNLTNEGWSISKTRQRHELRWYEAYVCMTVIDPSLGQPIRSELTSDKAGRGWRWNRDRN